MLARGGALLITADHGNIEQLIDPETGGPHTAHTTNPVPLYWVTARPRRQAPARRRASPTSPRACAQLLDLPVPRAMTGHSLLVDAR